MFSDFQLLIILFFLILISLTLHIQSILNFLIYSEIIWIIIFNIFALSAVTLNLNIFITLNILIIFVSTVELTTIIFLTIKFSNLTKLITNKNISTTLKKQLNKQYINKNLFWLYNKNK